MLTGDTTDLRGVSFDTIASGMEIE